MKLFVWAVLFFSIAGTNPGYKPQQKYFCPVDPNNYNKQVIQDSMDHFLADQIKIISDTSLKGMNFIVRLEYRYCERSTSREIQILKHLCESMFPKVKERYERFKNVVVYMRERKISPTEISLGQNCEEKIGLVLNLLVNL